MLHSENDSNYIEDDFNLRDLEELFPGWQKAD
jgi:hypothetical protein